MQLKDRVVLLLNRQVHFTILASDYFQESHKKINEATALTIETVIAALRIQCCQNRRSEEIWKISKECANLEFHTLFIRADSAFLAKGRSINSELFGVKLVNIVHQVAQKSSLKNNIAFPLINIITPVIFCALHQATANNNFTTHQMCRYIQHLTQENRPLPYQIEQELFAMRTHWVSGPIFNTVPPISPEREQSYAGLKQFVNSVFKRA